MQDEPSHELPLPRWALQALAEGAILEFNAADRRHDDVSARKAAEEGIPALRAIVADAATDAEARVRGLREASRMVMRLGDSIGALDLADRVSEVEGRSAGMEDRVPLAYQALRAGDLDTASALATDALVLAPAEVGASVDLYLPGPLDVLRSVAAARPELATMSLEIATDRLQREVDGAELADLTAGAGDERKAQWARIGLASSQRALAQAYDAAGRQDLAEGARRSWVGTISHPSLGSGMGSRFRGSAVHVADVAIGAGAMEDVEALMTDPSFDGALVRMMGHAVRAATDPLAGDGLEQAQVARQDAATILGNAFVASMQFSPEMTEERLAREVDRARAAAEKEVAGHYLSALSLALRRAEPELAGRLVDEGEIVVSALDSNVSTPLGRSDDLIGQWAGEVAASDERAGRPYGDAALRSVLRAKRAGGFGPGKTIGTAELDAIARKVVGGVVADRGVAPVRGALASLGADEVMMSGPDSAVAWDRVSGEVKAIALDSGAVVDEEGEALRAEVAEHHARAAVPESGSGGSLAGVDALYVLARDPAYREAIVPAAAALVERLAARSPDERPSDVAVAVAEAGRLAAALDVDDVAALGAVVERLEDEVLATARAAAETFLADPPTMAAQLIGAGFAGAAEQLATELTGSEAESIRAAVARGAAIVRGESESAADMARWVDENAAHEPMETGRRIAVEALRGSKHRSVHVAAVPDAASWLAAPDGEWTIDDLFGLAEGLDGLATGPEVAPDLEPWQDPDDLGGQSKRRRAIDDLPDHGADPEISREQSVDDLDEPGKGLDEPDLGF